MKTRTAASLAGLCGVVVFFAVPSPWYSLSGPHPPFVDGEARLMGLLAAATAAVVALSKSPRPGLATRGASMICPCAFGVAAWLIFVDWRLAESEFGEDALSRWQRDSAVAFWTAVFGAALSVIACLKTSARAQTDRAAREARSIPAVFE